jgi:ribosome biogenesis GTPase A
MPSKHGFKKGASSDNPDRIKDAKDTNKRDKGTISRLKMYRGGKPVRDRDGKIIGGSLMSRDRAGDHKITSATGRIQPDRRWFGNTRVVGAQELDDFREAVTKQRADPYAVLLRAKKFPMSLVSSADGRVEGPGLDDETAAREDAERLAKGASEPTGPTGSLQLTSLAGHRLTNPIDTAASQSAASRGSKSAMAVAARAGGFKRSFGPKHGRKKVNLSTFAGGAGSMEELAAAVAGKTSRYDEVKDSDRSKAEEAGVLDHDRLVAQAGLGVVEKVSPVAADSEEAFRDAMGADDEWEMDEHGNLVGDAVTKSGVFSKGQSKRIWGELFKVLDCSDVVVQVLDARDPMGTRSAKLENFLRRDARHKHLVFVLNKCDLVPVWVTRRWVAQLSKEYPTLAFHASAGAPFGKGALIQLLQQYSRLHAEKPQISVGFVGYPNVGKSSVINAVMGKPVCKVAPVPGETKVWQYIALFKRVFLIDCPGVVPVSDDSETAVVLKGVTRSERLPDPESHIPAILMRCEKRHIQATYGIKGWKTSVDFLSQLAKKQGKLLKGGNPDLPTVAKAMINDWQRGRIPYYAPPPGPTVRASEAPVAATEEPENPDVTQLEKPDQDWARLRVQDTWKGEADPDAVPEPDKPKAASASSSKGKRPSKRARSADRTSAPKRQATFSTLDLDELDV